METTVIESNSLNPSNHCEECTKRCTCFLCEIVEVQTVLGIHCIDSTYLCAQVNLFLVAIWMMCSYQVLSRTFLVNNYLNPVMQATIVIYNHILPILLNKVQMYTRSISQQFCIIFSLYSAC